MSEATVRASIKTLVEGVTDIGIVYDLQPIATTWDVLLDRFKTTISSVEMIRAWTISCEAIERQGFVASGARNTGNINIYQYKVRGYTSMNFATSTEKAFLIVALAVMDALDGGIVSGNVYNADLAQLTSYQPDMLGGVLCHVAEITQIVREQI